MSEDPLPTRVDAIVTRMRAPLTGSGVPTDEQQKLAARLVNTLPYLQRLKSARVNVAQAEIAADALVKEPPDLLLADGIVADLERRIRIYKSTWRSVFEGRTPASPVVLGLICHVVLAGLLLLSVLATARRWASGSPEAVVLPWVLVGGSAGGLVSLLARLPDFPILARWAPDSDPRLLFYTGLLKPLVSIAFAFFVWAALRIGVVALPMLSSTEEHRIVVAFVVAFIAGFSERLAPDLANRTFPSGPGVGDR